MAKFRKAGVVDKVVSLQPPASQKRSNERSDHAAYVDEHVENLETRISLCFSPFKFFLGNLCAFGLEVIEVTEVIAVFDRLEVFWKFRSSVVSGVQTIP